MPLVSRTFDQLIDFTRTSAATYVDASGRIVPTPASRNLLTFTQEFDNAAWSKTGVSASQNTAAAPDGTLTADKITPDTNSGTKAVRKIVASSGTNTWSFYAKAAGYTKVGVWDHAITGAYASFNLTGAGSVLASGSGASGATITSVGNGWYRCSFVAAASGNIGFSFQVLPDSYTTGPIAGLWTGDGTSGVFLWGAQLEANTTATDYTRNNGGVYPPRFDYDPVTLAPKGLLVEEQRTNLLVRSEEFDNASWVKGGVTVTANAAVSPDGTQDADLLTGTGATPRIHQLTTLVSGQSYTATCYVKQGTSASIGFDAVNISNGPVFTFATKSWSTISGVFTAASYQELSNGWFRLSITFTSNTTSAGPGWYVSGLTTAWLWGAQLEAGSFATSYIPTVASQVTRTADVATITGANFSQWYNQSEGSLVVEGSVYAFPAASSNNAIAALSDGTTANSHYVYTFGSAGYAATQVSSVVQANPTSGSALSVNTPYKMAYGYKTNDFAFTVNGATVGTDASGTVPAVDQLQIGRVGSTILLNGWIRSIRFFPTRLSNAQLQALTA